MANTFHCAAVDLGATSGRVIVGSWSDGALELAEVHRFPNEFECLGTHAYWNVPGLWSQIRAGLREAKRRFPKLHSVGVDAWGVDYVLLDRTGRLVFPAHAYRDPRTQGRFQALIGDSRRLEAVYAATGLPPLFFNTSVQLEETALAYPALAQIVDRCLFLPDYFNFLLSGRAENEISICSTSQLLSLETADWSDEALRLFSVPRHWLRQPILAGARLGPVVGVEELGGVEVVAVPGHDTACAFAGIPKTSGRRELFISSGTWSLVGCERDRPFIGPEACQARISNERTGEGGFRPVIGIMGLWLLERSLKEFGERPAGAEAWRGLLAEARALPKPQVLLDASDPRFAHPTSMRAAIDEHLRAKNAPRPPGLAGYVRLICESLGQAHALAAGILTRLGGEPFERILLVGGGAKNALLGQATADALGLPVQAYELEATAIGNLAWQLLALGAVPTLQTVRDAVRERFRPTCYEPGKGAT